MTDLSHLLTEVAATSRDLIQQRQAEWEREWITRSYRQLSELRAGIESAIKETRNA